MSNALLILKALLKALTIGSKVLKKTPKSRYVRPSETNLTPAHHWQSHKDYEFDCNIVGESNYQKHLQTLAGDHDKKSASYKTTAVLVPEPSNPYDKNAVCVYISGGVVGYLDKEGATKFLRRLTRQKLTKTATTSCDAEVIGGFINKDGSKASYGVRLDIKPFDNI